MDSYSCALIVVAISQSVSIVLLVGLAIWLCRNAKRQSDEIKDMLGNGE